MCPNPGTEHSGVSFRMKAFSYQGQTFLFHLGVSQFSEVSCHVCLQFSTNSAAPSQKRSHGILYLANAGLFWSAHGSYTRKSGMLLAAKTSSHLWGNTQVKDTELRSQNPAQMQPCLRAPGFSSAQSIFSQHHPI